MSVPRGELREALRSAGISPDEIPRVAFAVEGIVSKAEDSVLRELSAFLAIRQCSSRTGPTTRCEKDSGHPDGHASYGAKWHPRTFEEFIELRHEKGLRASRRNRWASDAIGELIWPPEPAQGSQERAQLESEALELLASVSGRTHGLEWLGGGRCRLGFETGEIEVGPGQKIIRYEDGTVLVRDA